MASTTYKDLQKEISILKVVKRKPLPLTKR